MEGKLCEIIKNLDIIGIKPSINIKNSKRYTTCIGGILSIGIYIIIILSLLYFTQEFFLRRFPNESISSMYVENKDEPIKLNEKSNWVLIFIKDQNENYMTNLTNIMIESSIFERNGTETKIFKNTSNMKCNELYSLSSDFKNSYYYNMNKSYLSYGYCVNNVELNEVLNKKYSYSRRLNIEMNFYNIRKLNISSIEILYFFNDLNVDVYDKFNSKSEIRFMKYQSYISPHLKKKVFINLSRNNINTDKGYFLNDYYSENILSVSTINEQVIDFTGFNADGNDENINHQIEISLSPVKKIIFRHYLKIPFIVASFGGIIKAICMMTYCLNLCQSKTRYYEYLISSIFDTNDLLKNYRFYGNKLKYFKKYRNSIALRRNKDFELLKRERTNYLVNNNSNNPSRQNFFPSENNFSSNSPKQENAKSSCQNLVNSIENSQILDKMQIDITNFQKNLDKMQIEIGNDYNNEPIEENVVTVIQSNNNANALQINESLTNIKFNNNLRDFRESGKNTSTITHDFLKTNKTFKQNFLKMKNERFSLKCIDILKIYLCCKSKQTQINKNIIESGKFLIHKRLDVVSLLTKLLDFDRFKNLILKDYQIVLLNSLSRFVLDPETLNLRDVNNMTLDKLTDAIVESSKSNSVIDNNLKEFIKLKFNLLDQSN